MRGIKLMNATNEANQSQVNLVAAFQATQDISRELNVDKLVNLSLSTLLELSGAQSGVVILADDQKFAIAAMLSKRSPNSEIKQSLTLASADASSLPILMVRYTLDNRTETTWYQDKPNLDLAPFRKSLSGNGFKNNFKAMTGSNIGTNLKIPEKFQPKDRRE